MTTPAGRSDDRPVGRYGPPRGDRSRRWLTPGVLVLVVLAVVALGWLVWVSVARQSPVNASDVGFVIPDDQHVRVTYDVTKDRDLTARCTLTAMDSAKRTVGVATVLIGPARTDVTRHTDTVRTSAMAVTGFVSGCEPEEGTGR